MGQKKFDREEARKLMEAGWNNVMIAEKFGVNPKSIREYRHKIGLPPSTTKRVRGERDGLIRAPRTYVVQDKRPVIPPKPIAAAGESVYPTFDGNKLCPQCVYRITVYPHTACGYILATGHSRDCAFGSDCDKFLKGNPEDIVWKTM